MVCIYARQSIDKKDSISIESQIEKCKKEFDDKEEEFKVYIDKGFSGKNTDRPQFKQLMSDVKNGLVTKVIVYKLDRISRAIVDFGKIMQQFNKYNIEFISYTEKFDTSTPIGKAMLNIIMVFAQLERETIQLRVKDNYYARGSKGMYLGGQAPYGFKKISVKLNNKQTYSLEIDELEIDTLKFIFETYANSNISLGGITKELNKKQIPSPAGTMWDSGKLSRIMRNPIYVKSNSDIYLYYKNKDCILSNQLEEFVNDYGCYLYGKREANERKYTNLKDHVLSIALHKGIIDADIFLKCQYKLDNNKQIKNTGKSTNSWLSGLTKCGYCGYSMTISRLYKETFVFCCSGRKNKIPCERTKLSLKIKEVEEFVEKSLYDMIQSKKSIGLNETKNTLNNNNEFKIQIIKIDEKINNLVEQMMNTSTIVSKYINEKITSLDKQKQDILKKIQKNSYNKIDNRELIKLINLADEWESLCIEQKKEIASAFIEKIIFYDNEIEIKYNHDFI